MIFYLAVFIESISQGPLHALSCYSFYFQQVTKRLSTQELEEIVEQEEQVNFTKDQKS